MNVLVLFLIVFWTSAAAAEEGLRDVKPPVDVPVPLVWIAVATALVLMILVFLWGRRRNVPKNIDIHPVKLPWEIALAELEEVERLDLIGQAKSQEFSLRVSQIIRHFFERQFAVRAPDMTTEEFLFSLQSFSVLAQTHKDNLKDFLTACDMVKFAKYNPLRVDLENMFHVAKVIIEDTAKKYPKEGKN